jgi:hypothetical protein
MRGWGMAAGIGILVLAAIVYLGGAIEVGGAPLFWHMDQKLGTNCMGLHWKLVGVFRRVDPEEQEEDSFSKQRKEFDKVLKQNVE